MLAVCFLGVAAFAVEVYGAVYVPLLDDEAGRQVRSCLIAQMRSFVGC
jgi:hypothetical protein